MATPPVYDNRTDAEKHAAYAQQGLPEPPWASFQQDRMGPMPTPAPAPVPPPAQQPQVQPQGQQMTADPVQAQQQMMERTGQPFRVEAQAPEFGRPMYRQDFYGPGAMDPFVTRSTPGKYGGAPIILPKVGQAPMSVLAERQSAINKERQRLEQEKQQFDPYADFTPVIPPAYQKSWQQAINSTVNEQLQATVELYGGDEMAAYKALRDPMSKEGRAWRQKINDINTTTNQVNRNFENALGYVEAVNAGAAQMNPELYKRAENLIAGLEGFDGDWAKLGSKAEEFEKIISLDKYIKDYGMHQRFMDAAQNQPGGISWDQKNGNLLLTEENKVTWDAMFEDVSDHLSKVLRTDKPSVRNYLEATYPTDVKRDLTVIRPNTSGSSGGGDYEPPKQRGRIGTMTTNIEEWPEFTSMPDKENLAVFLEEETGGKLHAAKKLELDVGEGKTEDLYAPNLFYNPIDNEWYFTGRSLNENEVEKANAEYAHWRQTAGTADKDSKYNEHVHETEIYAKYGKVKNYKVEGGNRARVERFLGVRDPNEYIARQLGNGFTAEMVDKMMRNAQDRADLMKLLR